MAIAVMVEGRHPVHGLTPFADGFLTSRGTFQKYLSPHEFRAFVRQALYIEPVAVAPGIVLVFRDPETEQEFLYRRRSRPPMPSEILASTALARRAARLREPLSERLSPILDQLWAKAMELGRNPDPDEIPEIVEVLSKWNVSVSLAMGWCRSVFDEPQLETGARRKRDDLLVHFALGAFSGSRAFNTLPLTLLRDVRSFFGSFGALSPRHADSYSRWAPMACGRSMRVVRTIRAHPSLEGIPLSF
jgi:DNA phosphorothioation-associated putative methyltransferase